MFSLLAVIGPNWAALNGRRARRIHGGVTDWVRWEIAEALTLGITVIPILIESAELPDERDLPADIARMTRHQHLRLNDRTIEDDIARVVDELCRLVPHLSTPSPLSVIRD